MLSLTAEIALRQELADLFITCFLDAYQDSPAEEVEHCLNESWIAMSALVDGHLAGFVGTIPNYGTTGWELHPLAVFPEYQRQGIGKALVKALEREVKSRGGITLYLGTDDEFCRTSLSNVDLYDRLWERIESIKISTTIPLRFIRNRDT